MDWWSAAQRTWPGLQVDYVGQLVRGGDYEVVFSVPRRGLQFRAGTLAEVEHWMGPPVQIVQRTPAPQAPAKIVQRTLF
jgi:hypothetical protein